MAAYIDPNRQKIISKQESVIDNFYDGVYLYTTLSLVIILLLIFVSNRKIILGLLFVECIILWYGIFFDGWFYAPECWWSSCPTVIWFWNWPTYYLWVVWVILWLTLLKLMTLLNNKILIIVIIIFSNLLLIWGIYFIFTEWPISYYQKHIESISLN